MFFFVAFVFFAAGYILLPTLPVILHGRGASPLEVGIVMGSFTAAAVLLRGPAARLLGRVSPRRMLSMGVLLVGLGFAAYIPPSLYSSIAGRLVQGAGLAAFSTAAFLYLEQLGGPARRAEYISLFGLSANVAMSMAPAAGSLLRETAGEYGLYALGAGLCAAGVLAVPPGPSAAPAKGSGFWTPAAWRPSLALLGFALGYGAVVVFVPVAMERRGVAHGWTFFSFYAVWIIATRLLTRRLLDRGTRARWNAAGSAATLIALGILARAQSLSWFLVAAAFFGVGVGMSHPTLMALALESAPADQRSAATTMSTSAFDSGIALGAALAGLLADHFSIAWAFLLNGALLALLMLPLHAPPRRKAAAP